MAPAEGTAALSRKTFRVRSASIEVTAGTDEGRTAAIDRPTFVIGSGDGADLRLTDPSVSREHLRLRLEEDGVRVEDDGSKNGTWIGMARVRDLLLSADAALDVGQSSIVIRIDAAPLELPIADATRFGDAIGVSMAMRHLFAVLERAALTEVTVLLEGE